ncbi:hypothetical protein [Salinifilum ghardaiensis]
MLSRVRHIPGGYCEEYWCTSGTQSARRHRIGRARATEVLAAPVAVLAVAGPSGREMRMVLDDDHTGRALEVGVLDGADGVLVVVHVMDLRAKYRGYCERGKEGEDA